MPLEERESVDPITLRVNISEAWDTVSVADMFIETLRKAGICGNHLLFCGFDGRKSPKTVGFVHCAPETALKMEVVEENQNPIEFALEHSKPAIAIYDGNKIAEMTSASGYRFSDPSALIAIAYLTHLSSARWV